MGDARSKSGILIAIAIAAAAGALGAAAMMSAVAAPAARADDTSLIIDAIDGDYAAGQTDFTAAFTDFGSGDFVGGLADTFGGVNEDSVAAPDNLLLGTVEALEGDPITSTLFFDDLSAPDTFADASSQAQIYYTEGQDFLSNAAIALSAGDYGSGTYLDLAGSADAYVLSVEELLLGAAVAIDPTPTI